MTFHSTEHMCITTEVPVDWKLSSLKVEFVGFFLEDTLKIVYNFFLDKAAKLDKEKNYYQIIK